MKTLLTTAVVVVCCVSLPSWSEESAEHFETTINKRVTAKYLLIKPKDYSASEEYPLLIFLHGRGEQGDDLEKVRIHGPFNKISELDIPVIIVAPQSPLDEWWDVDTLEALTEELIGELNVDEDRVYLTGLSMGGAATWELGVRHPEWFAAIAPICGWSVPSKASRLKNVAVWAFHGRRDKVIPVQETINMINSINETNTDARLTIYPDAGHDSWTETYDNPELYKWLFSKRRVGDGGRP